MGVRAGRPDGYGLSRMRDDTQLITDDPAKLQRNIERQTGEKIAALDGLEKTAPQSTGKTASEEVKIRDEKEAQKDPQIDPKTSPEQTSIFDVLNGRDRDPKSPEVSKDDHEKDPRKDQSVRELLGDFPRPEIPADVQRQLDKWTERLEREKAKGHDNDGYTHTARTCDLGCCVGLRQREPSEAS